MAGSSQTTRARGRHAQSRSTHLPSELGILSEDTLQDKVLEQEREIEQLRAQIMSLERQLLTRPPLKDVQNLELLLQGTQRENERCMADIQRGKERERLLEKELSNLLGEHWQRKLEFEYPTGDGALHSKQRHDSPQLSEADAIIQGGDVPIQSIVRDNNLASHLERIKLMVLGMDQKLEEGETRIRTLMADAQRKTDALSRQNLVIGSHREY